KGIPAQWPSMLLLSKTGEIHKDDNYGVIDDYTMRESRLGLGPSFIFNRLVDSQEIAKTKIRKGSIKVIYNNDQLSEDSYYQAKNNFSDSLNISHSRDIFSCELSQRNGLQCTVKCSPETADECQTITSWHDVQDPIVEIHNTSYPGLYAMTKKGKLLHITRQKQEVSKAEVLHEDIKFRSNKSGRFFINSNSDSACIQSEELDIYCDIHDSTPRLGKLKYRPEFFVEEVSFTTRHNCLLSDKGEVWCNGDNSCGQITGRHDDIQHFKSLQKVEVLAPAKQIFTYAGGTCALLNDGRLQCFGLGASVLRKRLLNEDKYSRSFAWHHGFRPHKICAGGAENGI
ncbi:MAG TPA: RCC1 domain-containing protein, partial [Myxococcota bacterium]|nr:RCC1 domain-containing protein [Myxococcota bacterium]